MEIVAKFEECLKQHHIELNDTQKKQFEIYKEMLVEWNEKMNLTSILDDEGIYMKHFYDSLIPSFNVKIKGSLCDVGSGAGFPSIPLKIMYPEIDVTIIETLGKRVTFLKELTKKLGIEATILHARAEECNDLRESFDIVSARAVANMPLLCELCIPLVKVGGCFLVMKGSNGLEELNESKKALRVLGCKVKNVYENHEEDTTRINIECEKIKATPKGYPRAFAKMKKNPLKGV